jgi:hypothetical protein
MTQAKDLLQASPQQSADIKGSSGQIAPAGCILRDDQPHRRSCSTKVTNPKAHNANDFPQERGDQALGANGKGGMHQCAAARGQSNQQRNNNCPSFNKNKTGAHKAHFAEDQDEAGVPAGSSKG